MLSLLFIRRPKTAAVISIALFLAGVLCAFRLPLSEYPTVAPPQIEVSAFYAGASADEIANTVAAPIESQINSVEDLIYFDSKSDNSGNYTLTVTFKPGADENMALVNVNNAVKLVEPKLPAEVKANGVTVAKKSPDMLCAIALYSTNTKHSAVELSTFADLRIKDTLTRIDGVGSVGIFGEAKRSMRCWLDPEMMRAMGISIDEVKRAIASQNLQAAAGAVGTEGAGEMLQYKILADGRLKTAEEFGNIVVRNSADGMRQVRLHDIARIELGSEHYNNTFKFNGHTGVMVAIFMLNHGNALNIFDQAMEVMKSVEPAMDEGMQWAVAFDTTAFVRASMEEIVETLLETFLLVVLITWIFLQSWRATLVPMVAIPVSLMGTFLFLSLCGISINTLSMFALILVIGSVVDDAICVTESCMAKLDQGLTAMDAAISTMKEISGALVATTLVVVAVYAPIGFAQGMVGTIYLQFSITMCVALCLSTVCALTLSCAMGARVLAKPPAPKGFFKVFNTVFDRFRDFATGCSKAMIKAMPITVAVFVAIVAAAVWLFKSIPTEFIANEDKGLMFVEVTLPPGTVISRTSEVIDELARRISAMDEVKSVGAVCGRSMTSGAGENLGFLPTMLKPWDERPGEEHSVFAVQKRIMALAAGIAEAKVMVLVPPPIAGLGNAGGVSFLLQAANGQSYAELARASQELAGRLMNSGKVLYAFPTFEASTPLIKFRLDRQLAEQMGVKVSDVFTALQGQLGSYYVNDFNLDGKNYQVNIQADLENRATVNQLANLHVTGAKGAQVPILSIGNFDWTVGPRQVERFNLFTSAFFQSQPARGTSSGELMREIERQVKEMGPEWQVAFTDLSFQERQNEGEIAWMLILSVLMAYLFLVGQYESWTVPVPVMLCVIVSLFGGLLGIKLSGVAMNIYCQLGVLMLIGITAKSAILIAEYAMQKEEQGMGLVDAAVDGMKQRFRSVQMTAISFVIGVLPLLTATGAGANARHAVGVATFYGMLTATLIGMLFVPPLYVLFRRFVGKRHSST